MKYEMTEKEMLAQTQTIGRIIDTIGKQAIGLLKKQLDLDHKYKMRRLELEEQHRQWQRTNHQTDVEEDSEEEPITLTVDQDVVSKEYTVTASVEGEALVYDRTTRKIHTLNTNDLMQTLHSPVDLSEIAVAHREKSPLFEGYFPEPRLNDHQSNGRDELQNLLAFWLVGFQEDDAEQPDRNEYMIDLSIDGKRAGAMVSYCMQVGGLTKGCWNLVHELNTSQEATPEFVRYVAGNITQVASCHLAPLADQFEYPNPLQGIKYPLEK